MPELDMESREQGATAFARAFTLGWDDGDANKPECYGREIARRIGAKCTRRMQPTRLRAAYYAGYATAQMQAQGK